MWTGHSRRERLPLERYEVRAHIRFSQDEWLALDEIAHAACTDVAPIVSALLSLGIRDERVTQTAAPGFVPRSYYSLKEGTVQWPK